MPGERADVIIDFAGLTPGTRLIMRNVAKTPYPAGDTVNGSTLGRIMQFRVIAGGGVDTSYDPAGGGALRSPMVRLVDPRGGHSGPGRGGSEEAPDDAQRSSRAAHRGQRNRL